MDFSPADLITRIKTITPLKKLEEIGFNQNTINNWKFRNVFPKSDDLYRIAEFLNVDMTWLLTGESPNNELQPDEFEILSNYRQLSDSDKSMVQIMLATMATSKK